MQFKQTYITLILIFTIILVLFFNLGQWFLYSQVRHFAESTFRENLLAQTELAALSFDGDIVQELQNDNFYPPDLIAVQSNVDNLKKDFYYFNLRLLDMDGMPVISDPEIDSIGFTFDYDLAPFLSASTGIAASSELISAQGLYLISAYAPIQNNVDSVVAVLGIDADYRFFKSLADFKKTLVTINIVSFIFIIIFGMVFLIINRRLIVAQEALFRASALSSMGQMAATMAHEIKNPLGIIKATAQRIKSKYGKDSDDRVFDFISEEVDRLNQILTGYLDFARPAESNRKPRLLDLKILLEELVRQCRTDLKADSIVIDFNVKKSGFPVRGDEVGLRQAILNLIINAGDAYDEGGTIEITMQKTADHHKIQLVDKAGGIGKEVEKKLFEPFTTTKAKGSGLGLYVSRKIIEKNGGKLNIKNNNFGGATAEIILPRYKEN